MSWWPSVYLRASELAPGDETGVGKVIDLYTKGWLPYTLRWRFEVIEVEYEKRLVVAAHGDFEGSGVWTFEQEGDMAVITYDWQIRVQKPLLQRLTWLLRPLFSANHRWAMSMGERSLRLELARRHATTPEELRAIPPPPGPTPTMPHNLVLGCAAVIALLVGAWQRRRS